jgi:catechol 2,3-dioxygenase-like lactoylglutathione lyase family enzyme
MLTNLSIVMLGAADLARSAAFYADTLGLRPNGQFEDFAFFDAGGVSLALSAELARRTGGAQEAAEFVFGVASVEQSYRELRERGVAFENEPRQINAENWAVNFRDPDGHLLSLYGKQ